jgi:peptidoglycan/LPS O-acetylase OafA/YrhL
LNRNLRLCACSIAAFSAYRTVLYAVLNWGHLGRPGSVATTWIYFATDTRLEVILIGCAAALSMEDHRIMAFWRRMRQRQMFPWIALVMAGACIAFVTGGLPSAASWRSATFGYTLAGAATAVLVIAVFLQPGSIVARLLSWGPLVSLGTISYGVYLFHLPIAYLLVDLSRRLSWPGAALLASTPITRFVLTAVAVTALTWFAAAVHYQRIERRILQMRPATPKPTAAGMPEPAAAAPKRARVSAPKYFSPIGVLNFYPLHLTRERVRLWVSSMRTGYGADSRRHNNSRRRVD